MSLRLHGNVFESPQCSAESEDYESEVRSSLCNCLTPFGGVVFPVPFIKFKTYVSINGWKTSNNFLKLIGFEGSVLNSGGSTKIFSVC